MEISQENTGNETDRILFRGGRSTAKRSAQNAGSLIFLGCLLFGALPSFSSLPAFAAPAISFSEIDSGKTVAVRAKLQEGANPDQINRDGQSLLWEAAFSGREDMVRLLLSFGADPDLPDSSGKPPLYWAATNGEAGIVRLLLAHGADPNRRDGEGSALEWAIANGHTRVVWLLNHWTEIRRKYLLERLPLFLSLISRKDRVRLQEGQLIRGPLPYALPHGLMTAPWKNPQSFILEAKKADRKRLPTRFAEKGSYPLWRENALREIAANLGRRPAP
jgi:ankyrin repeat protein